VTLLSVCSLLRRGCCQHACAVLVVNSVLTLRDVGSASPTPAMCSCPPTRVCVCDVCALTLNGLLGLPLRLASADRIATFQHFACSVRVETVRDRRTRMNSCLVDFAHRRPFAARAARIGEYTPSSASVAFGDSVLNRARNVRYALTCVSPHPRNLNHLGNRSGLNDTAIACAYAQARHLDGGFSSIELELPASESSRARGVNVEAGAMRMYFTARTWVERAKHRSGWNHTSSTLVSQA
jgi:hypothetical protein